MKKTVQFLLFISCITSQAQANVFPGLLSDCQRLASEWDRVQGRDSVANRACSSDSDCGGYACLPWYVSSNPDQTPWGFRGTLACKRCSPTQRNSSSGEMGIGFPGTGTPPTQSPPQAAQPEIGIGFPGTGTPNVPTTSPEYNPNNFTLCNQLVNAFSPNSGGACHSQGSICPNGAPCMPAYFDVDQNRRPLPQGRIACFQCRPDRAQNTPGQIGIGFPGTGTPPTQSPPPSEIGIGFPGTGTPPPVQSPEMGISF